MGKQTLNEVQRQAVYAVDGPVLVLAGAGSGKTTVITNRAAHLIEDLGVDPYNILAITFTNKAASEMKSRIEAAVHADVSRMVICTFHSMCARFLRMDAQKIGYGNSFSIYDTDAAQMIVKNILSEKQIDAKVLAPRVCLSHISAAKNAHTKYTPQQVFEARCGQYSEEVLDIYQRYNERLRSENAMDFDDLLINMLELLQKDEGARNYYTRRFQYVMVDEYQDTNSVQYALVKTLSERGNLFVVGDDDQSIYAWRGADVRNILDFEKDYPNAKVIKLEENYRSHKKILDAANAVIQHAHERKEKTLWSKKTQGELPKVYTAATEYQEAEFIAKEIARLRGADGDYSDFAVLYRTHTQSRAIEEKLRVYGIPYRVYGGVSFYERKEIKDMLAYLTIIDNPAADTSLLRVINLPRRGIGDGTIAKLSQYAASKRCSLLEAIYAANSFLSGAAALRVRSFVACYDAMIACANAAQSLADLVEGVFVATGYRVMLEQTADADAQARVENVIELVNSAAIFDQTQEEANLTDFLASLSLITDMDTTSERGAVTLMTMHSAKGLEFDTVFMAGMEQEIFPSPRSLADRKIDEERRLCYVGITRAKQRLYLTNCEERTLFGSRHRANPSQFLQDIPEQLKEYLGERKSEKRRQEQNPSPSVHARPVTFAPKVEERDSSRFCTGMLIEHPKFGQGKIVSIAKAGANTVAVIAFGDGERKMFLEFAPLKIVG